MYTVTMYVIHMHNISCTISCTKLHTKDVENHKLKV